jgi:hypothetical protein
MNRKKGGIKNGIEWSRSKNVLRIELKIYVIKFISRLEDGKSRSKNPEAISQPQDCCMKHKFYSVLTAHESPSLISPMNQASQRRHSSSVAQIASRILWPRLFEASGKS